MLLTRMNAYQRWLMVSLLSLMALVLTAVFVPLAQAQTTTEQPVVQAVMFWSDTCPHCHIVMDDVIPPLQAQYGEQFQLHLVQIQSSADFDRLLAVAADAGVPESQVGVPLLLIGDAVLIGSGQIPAELPGLIDAYLAAGGVAYPDYPALAELLPHTAASGTVSTAINDSTYETNAWQNGFALAVLVMLGMVLALGYTAVRLSRTNFKLGKSRRAQNAPAWLGYAVPALAVLGLVVAAYLAYVETQAVTAVCGPIGDCNAVQTSPYAYFLGVPIGVWGVLGYVAILGVWAWNKWRPARQVVLTLLGMTLLGVLFSLYLTFLEPFVIGAVCAWCLTSAVIMTLLLLFSVETAVWQLQPVRRRRRR